MAQSTNGVASQADRESGVDETRRRILEAAAQVFSEKGYARATTRAIAAAAGVNEVTLFRHFGSKRNLLSAVIDQYSALPDLAAVLEGQLTGDYRHDLRRLCTVFLTALTERREAMRLMLCEADHLPEVREVMAQIPRQLRQSLAGYLQQQMEQGRVRDLNPELAAQALLGMFFAYAVGRSILADPAAPDLPPDEVVAQFVDIFVDGTIRQDL